MSSERSLKNKKINKQNIPELRLSGYNEEWSDLTIGDILEICYGKDYKELDEGDIPVFGTGGVIKYVDSFLYDKESVMIGRKGTINKPFFYDKPFWTVDTLFYTKINENYDPKFIYYLFNTIPWLKYNEATGVPSLTSKNIKNLKVKCPSYDEQKDISKFLSLIDKKIDSMEIKRKRIIELKNYFLQNLLCNRQNIPELRFPGFEGEWEYYKLNEIVTRITRKNKELETERPLTISAQDGLIDQVEFFDKIVASKNLKGYYLLKNGDFAYNKSYSTGYPYGTVKRLDFYDKGAVSTLYICFKNKDTVDSDFLKIYFDSNKWHKEMYKIAAEGARNHGLLNIAVGDFFNTKHVIPPLNEQKKIADFLQTIDEKIELMERDIGLFVSFKRSLLSNLFC